MSRRKKKQKKQLRTSLFIICEGTYTEPNYFKRIKEQYQDDGNYSIEIYIHETDTTHAEGLVEEASEYVGEYNEVWAIFDKDGYTKHKEAFEEAKKKNVNIAFSSIAFEHWILLHFEQNDTSFDKSADVIEHMENQGFFDDYDKSDEDIYPKIKGNTGQALVNAAWLRFTNPVGNNEIYDLNPYTDVDRLVAKLLLYNKEIYWTDKGQTLVADTIRATITYTWNTTLDIFIELTNLDSNSLIINANNQDQYFYLLNVQQEKIYFQPIENALFFTPQQTKKISLKTTNDLLKASHLLNIETDKERVIMPINS